MTLKAIGKFAKDVGMCVIHLRKLYNELIHDAITVDGIRYY